MPLGVRLSGPKQKRPPAPPADLPATERIAGDPRQARLRGDEAIGIETDCWHRLLPHALNRLWAQGVVDDPALPLLIKTLEPRLRRRDYLRPIARRGLWVVGILFGVPAALAFGAHLVLAPQAGHAPPRRATPFAPRQGRVS